MRISTTRTIREMAPAVHAADGLRWEATAPKAIGIDINPMPLTPMAVYSSCSVLRWKACITAN